MTTKTMNAPLPKRKCCCRTKIKTALPGPNAKRVLASDEQYISPSYTRSYPLVAKSGRGIVITDVDGNEFYDFSAGIAVTSTGHCHPDVVAAMQSRRRIDPHVRHGFLLREHGGTRRAPVEDRAHARPGQLILRQLGAEAIECALKLARYHTSGRTLSRSSARFMAGPWERFR